MGSGRGLVHAPRVEDAVRPWKPSVSAAKLPAVAGQGLIRVWQHTIGPMIPSSCRFLPSCSRYTYEALGEHGFWRGAWFGLKRLGKCHPWSAGGYDPVPDRRAVSR